MCLLEDPLPCHPQLLHDEAEHNILVVYSREQNVRLSAHGGSEVSALAGSSDISDSAKRPTPSLSSLQTGHH